APPALAVPQGTPGARRAALEAAQARLAAPVPRGAPAPAAAQAQRAAQVPAAPEVRVVQPACPPRAWALAPPGRRRAPSVAAPLVRCARSPTILGPQRATRVAPRPATLPAPRAATANRA